MTDFRVVAVAVAAALASSSAPPASAVNTVVGRVYQWGTTTCTSVGPLGQCTHAYSTAPPPIYGAACEERLLPATTGTPTCTVAFNGTSTQVGVTLPTTGPTCFGRGDATIEITSAHAGGPFTVPVSFTIQQGIVNFESAADFGTTHVEVNGLLSGSGICTGGAGGISDLAMSFFITY